MTKPTRLLDPRFKYTCAEKTTPDRLRKIFARIRREMAKDEPPMATVTPIKKEKFK